MDAHVCVGGARGRKPLQVPRDRRLCRARLMTRAYPEEQGDVDEYLSRLPAPLAARLRARKQARRVAEELRPPPQTPEPPVESGVGGRTLADIWDGEKARDAGTRSQRQEQAAGRMHAASARADANLLAEIARELAGSRSAPAAEGAGHERGSAGMQQPPKTKSAFMEAINSARPMATPEARPGQRSQRSEDEEIRVSRQQRMHAQGLSGRGQRSGWRAEDRSGGAGLEGQDTRASEPRAWTEGPGDGTGHLRGLLGSRKQSTAASADVAAVTAEEFTLREEKAAREGEGAKVITTDASYTPKVTTWGVFNRPRDISATYGGGRKLQPEDSVLSPEEKEAYDQRLKEKLAKLRRDSGLAVEPKVQAECEELTARGSALLDRGKLASALLLFEEASKLVPLKSEVGGKANLQRAITMDSMGRHTEAKSLYQRLKGHRSSEVARTARSMSFGFTAGQFLKTDTVALGSSLEDRDQRAALFAGLRGSWDSAYMASEEDKREAKRNNTILLALSVSIVVAPIGIVYYLAYC